MRRAMALTVIVMTLGCSTESPDGEADTGWVGTITTEGDVTTVINESGSVWGGTATLVEEASIGVEAGAAEYMLGQVTSITADADRIYVLDRQPPVVRVYDHDGNHLLNMGGEGQGPGEFSRPSSVVIVEDGRVVVRDDSNSRFSVFARDGELLDTWPFGDGAFWSASQTIIGPDGSLYRPGPMQRLSDQQRSVFGYERHVEGQEDDEPIPPPDLGYEAPYLRSGNSGGPVPLMPRGVVELAPSGWLAGIGDAYRFEVRRFDGTTMIVERSHEPIVVSDAEREWETRRETAFRRESVASWTWTGPGVPSTLPAFTHLYGDADGRIWVRRALPSVHIEDCTEDPQPEDRIVPCWQRRFATDVFAPDGRYLGAVESPREDGVLGLERGHVNGDMLVLQVRDELGTTRVKRFRLVSPGEE